MPSPAIPAAPLAQGKPQKCPPPIPGEQRWAWGEMHPLLPVCVPGWNAFHGSGRGAPRVFPTVFNPWNSAGLKGCLSQARNSSVRALPGNSQGRQGMLWMLQQVPGVLQGRFLHPLPARDLGLCLAASFLGILCLPFPSPGDTRSRGSRSIPPLSRN